MTSTTRSHVCVEGLSENLGDTYPHDLQMYQNVPFGDIILEELQEMSETRLKG